MTNEEMQRTIQFILEQQAQLTLNVGRLSEKVDRNADGISALLAIAEIHEREIAETRQSVDALRDSLTAVDERGRETNERLNALIDTVERYISERRNGQS